MFAAVRRIAPSSTAFRGLAGVLAIAAAGVLVPVSVLPAQASAQSPTVAAKGMVLLAPTGDRGQSPAPVDLQDFEIEVGGATADRPAPGDLLGTPAAAPAAVEPPTDAVAAAAPAPAPAPQPEPAPAPAPPPPPPVTPDERGAAALALLDHPWQQTGWTIDFEPGRPGYLGMAYVEERRIVVWVRPEQSIEHLASVVAHELGHAIDLTWNTPERRARWMELRGIDASNPWFGCSACTDFATPAGDFAEVFSYWQTGIDFQSRMAAYPEPEALEAMVSLFLP